MAKAKKTPETTSIFDDRDHAPDEDALATQLGRRKALWDALVAMPAEHLETTAQEWSYYTKKTGWILLLKGKGKTICTCIPARDELLVVFLFPERAVEVALGDDALAPVHQDIRDAKQYKMGRPFNVPVKTKKDLKIVNALVAIKIGSWAG